MASRNLIKFTGRNRSKTGTLAGSVVVAAKHSEDKDYFKVDKKEIEETSQIIFEPSTSRDQVVVSKQEIDFAKTITRIACSESVQKAVLQSMSEMALEDEKRNRTRVQNREVMSFQEKLLRRIDRLELEMKRLKQGEEEEEVEEEEVEHVEHNEDTEIMSTTTKIALGVVTVVVAALAFKFLTRTTAIKIVKSAQDWFFGGRRS